jgi:hypothetical protein
LITSISLERFRGFHSATLELKPLTVILGANSAGKSSFLQALAALHFIRRLKISPATLTPDGVNYSSWPLDFGTRQTLQSDGTLHEGGVRIKVGVRHADASADIAYDFGRKNSGESLDLSGIEIYDKPLAVTSGGTTEGILTLPQGATVKARQLVDQQLADPRRILFSRWRASNPYCDRLKALLKRRTVDC